MDGRMDDGWIDGWMDEAAEEELLSIGQEVSSIGYEKHLQNVQP